MQLTAPAGHGAVPDDLAVAVSQGAARLGHRPAITQLLPTGRQEQSAVSLAQWAAKGAHFLELELALRAGDVVQLDAPPGWTSAAVALGAWWAGIVISVGPRDDVEVAILHTSRVRTGSSGAEVFLLGDGIDGAPLVPAGQDSITGVGEAWVRAVQSFPDRPPAPRAAPDGLAVLEGTRPTTQAQLLALAGTHGDDLTLGLDGAGDDVTLDLALVCVRPLLFGRPTVVCRDVPLDASAGERIGRWREPGPGSDRHPHSGIGPNRGLGV